MKTQKKNYLLKNTLLIMMLTFLTLLSCNNSSSEGSDETETPKAPSMDVFGAAFMGDARAMKGHIAAKTDLNQKDPYGSSPLTIAATFGKTEVAKLLIAGGADVNVTSADGSTPLHTAAFFGRTEIVEALLANEADTNVRNSFQITALESMEAPFDQMKAAYDQIGKDLGPFGLKLNYDKIKAARPVIAEMIKKAQ